MRSISSFIYFLVFTTLFFRGYLTTGQELTNKRAEWFTDSRFGMFIHWGVYSGAEGYWKGEKLRYDNDYAEWIYYRNRIDRSEYLTLLKKFHWEEIDPEEWVLLAKQAGMKYITITAKHHDGFALWNSEVSDYDVYDHTAPPRDIIRDLSEACQKHGLKLGLYYSHWVDWEHPNGWDHSKEIYGISAEDYDDYWQKKVIPQMRELLTNYGPIGIIWFDMWIHHSKTVVTKDQLIQLKEMIRELQPDCLINSRLGLSVEEDRDVDFQTLGDNELGRTKKDHPFQTSATVAHSWGYHATDTEWKSTTTLLNSLINNVSLNGNFMLNIGPRANGDVPFEIEHRLLDMGQWLKINGESIYGCEAFNLPKDMHDWGRITSKKIDGDKFRLYLHIRNWPLGQMINLTGVKSKPEKIYLLADKQKKGLEFVYNEVVTTISLPHMPPDPYISVIVVEYEAKPEVNEGIVAKSVSGGFLLTPRNFSSAEGKEAITLPQKFGSIPEYLKVDHASEYYWKIYIDKPGKVYVDISYSYQGKQNGGDIIATLNGSDLKHEIQPTGKYVGEPNQKWEIDSFNSSRLDVINITEKGYYDLNLKIHAKKDQVVKFQWIWIDLPH
jgi:alpha-L-fucosidase